jgi:predicted nuclease with TOPRIM domain
LIPPDDDGIVVVMSETEPRTVTREEFNRELVQALDDLVADARHHGAIIKAAFDKPSRPPAAREVSPPYGEVPERLDRMDGRLDRMDGRLDQMDGRLDQMDGRLDQMDGRLDQMDRRLDQMDGRLERIERTLVEIRERMATKVELEATNENVKKMADGYVTIGKRLDAVADLLKLRVVMP